MHNVHDKRFVEIYFLFMAGSTNMKSSNKLIIDLGATILNQRSIKNGISMIQINMVCLYLVWTGFYYAVVIMRVS